MDDILISATRIRIFLATTSAAARLATAAFLVAAVVVCFAIVLRTGVVGWGRRIGPNGMIGEGFTAMCGAVGLLPTGLGSGLAAGGVFFAIGFFTAVRLSVCDLAGRRVPTLLTGCMTGFTDGFLAAAGWGFLVCCIAIFFELLTAIFLLPRAGAGLLGALPTTGLIRVVFWTGNPVAASYNFPFISTVPFGIFSSHINITSL